MALCTPRLQIKGHLGPSSYSVSGGLNDKVTAMQGPAPSLDDTNSSLKILIRHHRTQTLFSPKTSDFLVTLGDLVADSIPLEGLDKACGIVGSGVGSVDAWSGTLKLFLVPFTVESLRATQTGLLLVSSSP